MAVQTGTADPASRTARRADGPASRTARRADGPSSRTARRADAGVVQLSQRDIDGLLLCGEHYGAPYDLLAAALGVPPERLP